MIKIVTAMTKKGVIGKDGALPWHISDDLKLFKKLTTGSIVVMGRKTFESLDLPDGLPNRINIVLSRKGCVKYPNVTFTTNIDRVLNLGNYFVIGGASIYKAFFPYAQELYVSHIKKDYEGNVFFSKINWSGWEFTSGKEYPEFIFKKYQKRSCKY